MICIIGLIFCGLGSAFGVIAGRAGTNAWNTLAIGLTEQLGVSFGTASFLISLVVILIDLAGKGKIGFGTILNIIIIAVFSDLWLIPLRHLRAASNMVLGAFYALVGQVILSFATLLYMIPELGCGPRDTLMIIVGKKLPKIPIGAARFIIEVVVLAVGVLMGAPFWIGTVLVMALQASIFQLVCRLCRFEPRSLQHEDILDTVKRIGGGQRST